MSRQIVTWMHFLSFRQHVYGFACALATSLLALSMTQPPSPPGSLRLEASWNAGLNNLGYKHFYVVTQIACTFGPLGCLPGSGYSGGSNDHDENAWRADIVKRSLFTP
jgi:hypothetical protein